MNPEEPFGDCLASKKGDFETRIKNRRAAMALARRAAMNGDPICGAFFGAMDGLHGDPNADFMRDFYDVDFEDDSDDCRPY